MKASRIWVLYSVIRVGVFFAVFTLLMVYEIDWWLSAILAAIISLCVSYLFLRRPREKLARSIHDLRHGTGEIESDNDDDEVEDAAVDRALHTNPSGQSPRLEQ